jgi:hypothetical protein
VIDQQQIKELVKVAFWKLLGNKTFLQGKGLIVRLSKETSLDTLAVQGALASLAQSQWMSGVYANGIPTGTVIPLTERPSTPTPPSLTFWSSAMREVGLDEKEISALLPAHTTVYDFSYNDMVLLLRGLIKLRADQHTLLRAPSFIISAKYLLGSSKILDSLPNKALRMFGIDTSLFTGAPPVVLIAGPSSPKNVVLIENPHAFWKALESTATEKTAFLVTFGYGLSRHGDDFGSQLVSLLEYKTSLIGAICAGSPPSVQEMLRHKNISFWGDLDVEGIRIFQRLNKVIPQLTLSSLYEPMLKAVCDPAQSHAYVQAAAKHRQVGVRHSDLEREMNCLELLNACSERAVDQEIMSCDEIAVYAGGAYSVK